MITNERSVSLARRVIKRMWFVLVVVSGAAALTAMGCATQPDSGGYEVPGFWLGLFHGFTIVFSLIGSIFTDYRIYAFPNSGGWYDFGYVLGAAIFLGGGGASTRDG